MKMECPRCHNKNIDYLYEVNGHYYCRKCIEFQRVFSDLEIETKACIYPQKDVHYYLDFELSSQQKEISQQLVKNYQNHCNSLILAVCGSGKTEIVFELIAYALSKGERVCFCVPRKELVKELAKRIKKAFPHLLIGVLYGGYNKNSEAQMIVCTMHQLYRFENGIGFQLMIADEVDAFPFYHNEVLNQIFNHCCLQNYVKMSATVQKSDRHGEELLVMNRRYHGYDLPVPRLILCFSNIQKYVLLILLHMMKKKTIIYVPTLLQVDQMVSFLEHHHIQCLGVSSCHPSNQKSIEKLKKGVIKCLVSTTILERGVTIEDVQVIVYGCQHMIFDERTLIQIAGRVGRKPNHPNGYVYILSSVQTKEIRKCIKTIKRLNAMSV